MIRVAYIGNFVPPYSTENQVKFALERVGCEVGIIQQEDAWRAADPIAIFGLGGYDLTLYTRTHNHTALGSRWEHVWRRLEDVGVTTAAVHLDVFVGLSREHLLAERDALFTVGHLFTADGSPECARAMAQQGFNHHWLPPGVDERVIAWTATLTNESPAPGAPQIVFVGSRYGYHPEHPWRQTMLNTLDSQYGERFGWYGNRSPHGVLRGPDLDALYASDRIIVGDSCFARHRPYYWSDRIPETLGRGGMLLHPELPADWYTYGTHYLAYEPTPEGLLGQVERALGWSPEERAFIKAQGRALVARRDLWRHRMVELLRVCGLADRAEETG